MNDNLKGADENRLGLIIDEFIEELHQNETLSIDEFVAKHPQFQDELAEVLPSLQLLERARMSEPTPSELPEKIAHFRIISKLGSGGMGVVYEAFDESLNRRVALKVIRDVNPDSSSKFNQRFHQETMVVAKLTHANIVPIYSVGNHRGQEYFSMQLIDGASLERIIESLRELKPQSGNSKEDQKSIENLNEAHLASTIARTVTHVDYEQPDPHALKPVSADSSEYDSKIATEVDSTIYKNIARIGLQVAEALEYAHRRGVLHRDIKPANLIVDENQRAWVADFGLAKTDDIQLTQSGQLAGTVRYMCRERLNGENSELCDVYSLGATLFELSTLRPLFDGEDHPSLIQKIIGESAPSCRKCAPNIPQDLATIIDTATATDSVRRYQSAGALAEDLQRYLDRRPILAKPSNWLQKSVLWSRRNPVVASLIGAVVLLSLAFSVVSTLNSIRLRESVDKLANSMEAESAANESLKHSLEQLYVANARQALESNKMGRQVQGLASLTKAKETIAKFKDESAVGDARERLRQIEFDLHCMFDFELESSIFLSSDRESNVAEVTLSVDFQWIAYVDGQRKPVVRHIETGRTTLLFDDCMGTARFKFSPCSRWIVVHGSTYSGSQLMIFDLERNESVFKTPASGSALPFDFFHQQNIVLFQNADRQLQIFDLERKQIVETTEALEAGISYCSISPDDNNMAFVAAKTELISIEDCQVQLASRRPIPLVRHASAFAWHPTSRYLATGTNAGEIDIWESEGSASPEVPKLSFIGHSEAITRLEFYDHGASLCSSDSAGATSVWDSDRGRKQLDIEGILACSQPGSIAILTTQNRVDFLKQIQSSFRPLAYGWNRTSRIVDIDFSADETRMIYTGEHTGNSVWDLESFSATRFHDSFQRHLSARYVSDSSVICSGYDKVVLLDLALAAASNELTLTDKKTTQLASFPDASILSTQLPSDDERYLRFAISISTKKENRLELIEFDLVQQEGKLEQTLALNSRPTSLLSDSAGKYLGIANRGKQGVSVIEVATGITALQIPGIAPYDSVITFWNNQLLISEKNVIRFIDLESGNTTKTIDPKADRIGNLTISECGNWLAVACDDSVLLQHLNNDGRAYRLHPENNTVYNGSLQELPPGISISPGNRWVAVGTRTNTVHLWDIRDLVKP